MSFNTSNGAPNSAQTGRAPSDHWINFQRILRLTVMFLLCFTLPILAQVATGDILGTVKDSTGSIVPGATVRLVNVGTHETRTFKASGSGEYTFTALQPGTYTITVSSPSFKTFAANGVVLAAADRVRIDAALQAGSVGETIEVTATPSALQTDSTTVGSTITEKTLLDAPVNGRNYIALIQVQAGVNSGSSNSLSSGANETDRRLSSSVSANGQQEIYNNNQVDGLDNNSRTIGAPLLRPSVEAIAETRTEINLYTAEVGRTGGAAIDVITKSGSNQFHGSAYEFFRNDITDTRNFFVPTFARKPELRQNQFGGSLGGPIIKDRTFFFVDYENLRRIDGNNSVYTSTVPTLFEEQNPGTLCDQTSALTPAQSAATCTNPLTGLPIPAVPTASLNPTTLAYFKLFPAPNLPGTATNANNFFYNPASTLYSQLGDLRIDHHFSAKDTLFGRYSYNRTSNLTPPYFPSVNGVAAGGNIQGTLPSTNLTITHNGSFGYTHIFTPSLLLELRTAYTYFNLATLPLDFGTNYNNSGTYLVPNANQCIACSGLMPISVNGYGALGDIIATPFLNNEHNTQFAGTLTYTHGRQTIKAGGALIRRNFSFQLPVEPKGIAIFASASPQLSLANFFRGTPYIAARQAFLIKPYDRTWEPSGFLQDDWRATDNLTFNVGIRYDVFTKPNEKYGNAADFNLATLSVVQNATAGLQNSYHDISPRFGFDTTLGKGTVLRGGFGLTFYVDDSNNNLVLNNPPIGLNTGNVTETGLINVVGVPPVTSTTTSAYLTRPANGPDSYLEQFNLLLQKEYGGTVVTVGYVAELGRHIYDQVPNLNLPAPNGPVPAGTPAPRAPYATLLPGVSTINEYAPFGASSYNSMQVSLERRITHGLTANFNYTWAHNLDDVVAPFDGDGTLGNGFGLLPNNVSTYDYGNSALDLQSRFAGFFSYDLPIGKSGARLYRSVFSNFRFNGLGFWQTGSPFTVISSVPAINLPTVTADKPNQVVAHVQQSGSLSQQFSVSAFAQQPLGTAGSERRNQLFGPDLRRGDLSLFKTVYIREGVHLELRAECFNITNTPNFATPNRTISAYTGASAAGGGAPSTSGGLGTITQTVFGYSGRQFQFAGRFNF